MKKTIYFLVLALIMAAFAPFSVLVLAENDPLPLWDGSSADGFAGGDGSEKDPFRIETAEQLAFFCDEVNGGNPLEDKFVRLCADLRLNDEVFAYEPDTGLVKVSDGEHTAWCGTGKKGDKSGGDSEFDNIPSKRGKWYDENHTEIAEYPGQLLSWTCIGLNNVYFKGSFDGGGHTVYGVFVPATFTHSGLFSAIYDASLENLRLSQSFVTGYESAGGLVGRVVGSTDYKNEWSTIRNCYFDGVAVSKTNAGGIVGHTQKTPFLSLCENRGTVVSVESAGGIVGQGENVKRCINFGDIHGGDYVGGITGRSGQLTSGAVSNPGIFQCTNHGNVKGFQYVGGICGQESRVLRDCHNTGDVYGGNQYVGGIRGYTNSYRNEVSGCYNEGNVEGLTYVGGITGTGDVNSCYNIGNVKGSNMVGGIGGSSDALNCKNLGNVTATSQNAGGIVGKGGARVCCNYGDVTGNGFVGGIIGDAYDQQSPVRNCFNAGRITASSGSVGGIAGRCLTDIIGCCSVGSVSCGGVTEGHAIGAIVGFTQSSSISNSYFLKGGTLNAAGDTLGQVTVTSVKGCSEAELKRIETYVGFDFEGVWEMGEDYPTLQIQKTPHEATQSTDENYLCCEAPCTVAAQYRTSCTCGAVLEGIFEVGEPVAHIPSELWTVQGSYHHKNCIYCQKMMEQDLHTFEEGLVSVDGTEGRVTLVCRDCLYTQIHAFDYEPPVQQVPDKEEEPIPEKPVRPSTEEPKKAEFRIDPRFALLLAAGVVLGIIGYYGVTVIQRTRKAIKHKKGDFV